MTSIEAHCAFNADEQLLPLPTTELVSAVAVTHATYGVYTVYRLLLQPSFQVSNVHRIYGDNEQPLNLQQRVIQSGTGGWF